MKAVRAATRFLQKFAHLLVACLSCYDRMIFKGYLQLGGDEQLNRRVDGKLKIRRKDFLPQVAGFSEQLVQHSKRMAQEADAPWEYLQGKKRKEKLVDDLARERKHADGVLAVFCCLETCRSIRLLSGKTRPRLAFQRRQQRVLYD